MFRRIAEEARLLAVCVVCGSVLMACNASQVGKSAKSLPAWLEEALAREALSDTYYDVRSPDGRFTARVRASAPPSVEAKDDRYQVEIPVSDDSLVICAFPYEAEYEELGAAALAATVTAVLGGFAEMGMASKSRGFWGSRAGVLDDGTPFLGMTEVSVDAESAAYSPKAVAYERLQRTVYCGMVAVGFTETFNAVSRDFASSAKLEGASPEAVEPYYAIVARVSLDGQPIGIARHRLYERTSGGVTIVEDGSMFVPRADGLMGPLEQFDVTDIDELGRLELAEVSGLQFDESSSVLVEQHCEPAGCTVEAERDGDGATVAFSPPKPLVGTNAPAEMVKRATAEGVSKFADEIYVYALEGAPGATTIAFECKLDEARGAYRCGGTVQDVPFRSVVAPDGHAISSRIGTGRGALRTTTLWRSGRP